ncbi:MAG TPA: hypothetical protein VIH58_02160 [Chthoniobacterales bacterium]|jgi:hypothetical protein
MAFGHKIIRCAPLPLAKLYPQELDSLSSLTTSLTASSRSSNFGWIKRLALHLSSRLAFLPTKSKTACRAEGLPEAGEKQNAFADYLPTEAEEHRWCLWRPDHAGFDSKSIFESALIEE